MDKEIIDWDRKGNVVRFYLGKNGKQWGDDWNDAPYEHNAGTVYEEYVKGQKDITFNYDDLVLSPEDGVVNSVYSKEDMISRKVPCLIVVPLDVRQTNWSDNFGYWLGNPGVRSYYFGNTVEND